MEALSESIDSDGSASTDGEFVDIVTNTTPPPDIADDWTRFAEAVRIFAEEGTVPEEDMAELEAATERVSNYVLAECNVDIR